MVIGWVVRGSLWAVGVAAVGVAIHLDQPPPPCRAHYEHVAHAASRASLEEKLLDRWPDQRRAARLQVVGTGPAGDDSTTSADHVNAFDGRGVRLSGVVDVIHRPDGSWYAGSWRVCIHGEGRSE